MAAYELSKASSSFFCRESKKERSLLEQPNNKEVDREEGMKERTRASEERRIGERRRSVK